MLNKNGTGKKDESNEKKNCKHGAKIVLVTLLLFSFSLSLTPSFNLNSFAQTGSQSVQISISRENGQLKLQVNGNDPVDFEECGPTEEVLYEPTSSATETPGQPPAAETPTTTATPEQTPSEEQPPSLPEETSMPEEVTPVTTVSQEPTEQPSPESEQPTETPPPPGPGGGEPGGTWVNVPTSGLGPVTLLGYRWVQAHSQMTQNQWEDYMMQQFSNLSGEQLIATLSLLKGKDEEIMDCEAAFAFGEALHAQNKAKEEGRA